MKKLLFLLISILLSFCSINPANAQDQQIFSQFLCSQINHSYCKNISLDLSLGYDTYYSNGYNLTQEQNKTCQFLTKNDQSTMIDHKTSPAGSDRILRFVDNNNLSISRGSTSYKYTSITCSVPKPKILGCTNPEATNYNSQATEDDGTCIIPPPPPPKIPGCTNPNALNYNPDATEENGTCQERIEGCTDQTAINYNPQANVHIESQCQYPPEGPSEITGFFENSPTIQIGATTWTLRLKTNVENAYLNIAQMQTWDQFKVTEYTTENKDIIITMKQFDDDRLDIEECTNYEITIPKDAITAQIQNRTGTETIKNFSAITGNFSVKGCPEKPTNNDEQTGTGKIQEIQQKYKSTMNKDAFYVRLFDVDEDGNQHINLGNFIFLIGFAGFFISAMFLFLNFLKNSFIGKKSSR